MNYEVELTNKLFAMANKPYGDNAEDNIVIMTKTVLYAYTRQFGRFLPMDDLGVIGGMVASFDNTTKKIDVVALEKMFDMITKRIDRDLFDATAMTEDGFEDAKKTYRSVQARMCEHLGWSPVRADQSTLAEMMCEYLNALRGGSIPAITA